MFIERVREIAAVSNCNRFRGIFKNEFCASHVGSDGRKHFRIEEAWMLLITQSAESSLSLPLSVFLSCVKVCLRLDKI